MGGTALRWTVTASILLLVAVSHAEAQVWIGAADAPRRGSFEVGGGLVHAGGFTLGALPSQLTANTGNDAPPFTLFTTDSRVKAATGAQGRAAFYLSSSVAVEAGVRFSRPVLSTTLSDDAEDAEDVTAQETISRYVIDGSVIFHLQRLSFGGGRGVPFLAAGAGYLRELHEGNELVETGTEYHAGAGVKYWFGQGARRLGLRGDVGVSVRDGGFDFEETRRMLPTAGVSLVYLF